MRLIYIANNNGQGAAAHSAATARNPLLLAMCNWVLLHALHNTWDLTSKRPTQSVLFKDVSIKPGT